MHGVYMPRPAYAPTSHYRDGYQTEYDGGLSYFPDYGIVPMPLGETDLYDAAAGTVGGAIAGPVGATVGVATSNVIQRWFGGDAVDQARQERVNYVAQHAVNGNVNAMRIILAAPANVSGNERGMWETAYTLIKRENPQVVAAAEAIGPYWLPNSGDTATNYPKLREWIRQGESITQRVTSTVSDFFTGGSGAASTPTPYTSTGAGPAPTSGGVAPTTLLLGVAALAAVVMFARPSRRS